MDAELSSSMLNPLSNDLSLDAGAGVEGDAAMFSPDEREALARLRACYRTAGDALTPSEIARLEFLRWLYQSGRLQS